MEPEEVGRRLEELAQRRHELERHVAELGPLDDASRDQQLGIHARSINLLMQRMLVLEEAALAMNQRLDGMDPPPEW